MPVRKSWSTQHGGIFPDELAALRALPGIGDYTAAAVAAIAYDAPAVPVDGNVERVVARLFAVEEALPAAKPEIKRLAASLLPPRRAGDFAQALMDLGATLCSPKRPACALCPWNGECAAYARGDQETFPRKTPKREGKLRRGAAFVVLRADGLDPFAQAAGQGPARLDDGSAGQRLDARVRRTPCLAVRAAPERRQMAARAGPGAPRVHALST